MFEKKDEVIIKHNCLKHYKHIKNLKEKQGRKYVSKKGRVVAIQDEFIRVDFWNSVPSAFAVKKEHVKIVSKASDRQDVAGESLGNVQDYAPLEYLQAKELGKSSKQELSLRDQAKFSLEGLFESAPVELKTNAKKPSLEKLREAQATLKKIHEKEPSDEVLEIINQIQDEELVENTKAARYNEGKDPMHLVPPDAIRAMAKVLEVGAKKYALRNWELGASYSVPYASLMRHLLAFWDGEDLDPESGLPHVYHILMNSAMLVRYFEEFKELDDRPKKVK